VRFARSSAALLAAVLAAVTITPGDDRDAPPSPGDVGVVLTAIQGTDIEEIPVEFIGTYEDVLGPGLDLHLVRLEGPVADRIGVARGMSGSPVYVDGRLIGALSYRLGFLPSEPVAGVTPIEDILNAVRIGTSSAPAGHGVATPIGTPVQMGGVAGEVRQWAEPRMRELGFVPVAGGQSSGSDSKVIDLLPGSPVGVELARGDLTIAATGTVTWVDGERIYAFGHSFLGSGRIELPMIAVEVIHTLADMTGSLKLARLGPEVGMFTEDRLPAIVGYRDRRARMIPVELSVIGAGYGEQSFNFEIARHSRLAPVLSAVVVASALQSNPGRDRKMTMVASGRIRLQGLPDLPVEMAYAGDGSSNPGLGIAQTLHQILTQLWINPFSYPEVDGIELQVDVKDEAHMYRLEALRYDRGPLRPGQTLEVECILRKYREESVTETFELEVPRGLPRGTTLTLAVGPPDKIDQALGHQIVERLRSAKDLGAALRALGEMKSPHRLTAVLFREAGGVVSRGAAYEQLPPTAEHLLATRSATDATVRTKYSSLARSEIELNGPVEGGLAVKLLVDSDLETEKEN
jgi:hypothetical protein